METIQKNLTASEANRVEAADALRASETAISLANQRIAEIRGELRQVEAELAELKAQAQVLGRTVDNQRQTLGELVIRQYKAGHRETFRVLLDGDPTELPRRLRYLQALNEARAALLAQLREDLASLAGLTRDTAAKRAEMLKLESEETTTRVALERERRERAQVLGRISDAARRQRGELATLKRDENRLSRLIEELGRMARMLPRPQPPTRNDRIPEPARDGRAFAERKGTLALPVRGELASRFGGPREGGGTAWKGIFIRCAVGAEVRAVAGGQVVFSDWLRGFGNLLIIDHGDGYMSLYGYNEALLKPVGAIVQAADVVAMTGASGGSQDSGLYFELRHQGKAFDPLAWVGPLKP